MTKIKPDSRGLGPATHDFPCLSPQLPRFR
jgi:hypothetical protein